MATPSLPLDPYDWNPEQVTAHLLPHLPPSQHPTLTTSLLNNDVDGETLLTIVTYERLKSDLLISSMGHRGRLLRAIDALRRRSPKYQSHLQQLASNTPLPPDKDEMAVVVVAEAEIQPLNPPETRRKGRVPRKLRHFTPETVLTRFAPSPSPSPFPSPSPPPGPQRLLLPSSLPSPPEMDPEDPLDLLSSDVESPLVIPGVSTLLDNHQALRMARNGKTGKFEAVPLGLSWAIEENPGEAIEDIEENLGEAMEDVEESGPSTNMQMVVYNSAAPAATPERKRKRATKNDDNDTPMIIKASRKRRYLPTKGTPVDRLIYGKLDVGDEIPSEEEEEDGNFVIARKPAPPGHQLYVERQIRYLLRSAETAETVHNGHLRHGVKPYRESLVLRHRFQSVTVFTAQPGGTCKVTKENTETATFPWDDNAPTASQSTCDVQMVRFSTDPKKKKDAATAAANKNDTSEWDYLLKWQGVDNDTELPTLGESGSEGEYSLDTWEELAAENGGGPLSRPLGKSNQVPLGADEILEVLNEGEQAIINNWRKRDLPRKEARAWRLYRTAKKFRERKRTARDARLRIKELSERLEKMKAEIVGVGWTQKALVKKQVKVLELSVVEREEKKWLAGLMERKTTPEKPVKAASVKPITQGGEIDMLQNDEDADDEDGESLGSTTESYDDSTDDEGLDGFIVADHDKDMINGVAIEVEGEEEVEEELARKAAEDELIDSEESGSDSPPRLRRRSRGSRRVSDDEEGQVIGDENDADVEMGGMEDDNSLEEGEVEEAPTKLDKGKGVMNLIDSDSDSDSNSNSEFPIKAEPLATQKPQSSTTSSSKKDILIIDLTGDDDPPPKKKKNAWELRVEQKKRLGLRQTLSDDEVSEKAKTSKALVERLVQEAEQHERSAMWYRLEQFSPTETFEPLMSVVQQLYRSRFKDVPGLDEYNALVFRMIATIYLGWALGVTDTSQKLKRGQVDILTDTVRFGKYMDLLKNVLAPYCQKVNATPPPPPPPPPPPKEKKKQRKSGVGRAADSELEEPEDDNTPSSSSRRKKVKEVKENIHSKEQRETLNKQEKRRRDRENAEKKRNAGMIQDPTKVRVNLGKYAKDNDIFVDDSIAFYLKPHQKDGILFMWQQLVQAGQNRGALLAHTMGLGKTLQVIAVLHTIAAAAASDDKKTYEQIPEHLRKSRTLILSPPGLVDNWYDEFQQWVVDFEHLGEILRADAIIPKPEERISNIRKWYKNGGVLLMGYQYFRNLIFNSPAASAYPEEEHKRIKKMLLEGPNIIIADEAHQLKNQRANISDAARGFKSMSRIAMTGSPLSNNLLEYWSMIEWIDPSFLGPRKEFEDKYVQPIELGLYADSTHQDKRRCLKMLAVLKKDIGPKVHRMDITAIQHELPQKTEFLIKVPLTDLQLKMYEKFVRDPTTTGQLPEAPSAKGGFGRKFFDAIHLLSLICNHPLAFVETLEMRENNNQALRSSKPRTPPSASDDENAIVDIDDMDDDVNDLLSVTNKPYPWARALMNTVKEPLAIEHSYKMFLLKIIVGNAKAAGDQTLIFTHSTLTLAFLEKRLESWGVSFRKLDGKTPMNMRQKLTRDFNKGGIDVGLISTEAGGLGLNLPGANRVIIFDFKWSPMWEEQAIGRAYRLGQKKHVYVYRFHASGTYEEIVRNTVLFKNQLQTRVVDQLAPVRNATRSAKAYFQEPYTVPKQDISEFKGKDPLVLDKIIDRVDFIQAIENTETCQDMEDMLTEEEIQETDQLVQVERELRSKAQATTLDDNARKSDTEYRRTELGIAMGAPKTPPKAPPKAFSNGISETDLQLHLEQSRLVEETRARNLATLNRTPLPLRQPALIVKLKAPPPPPGPNEHVASLPPTVAGRTKSLSVSNSPVAAVQKVAQRERRSSSSSAPPSTAPPPSTPGTKGRWSSKGSDMHTTPAPAPLSAPAKANQTAKRVTPSTTPTASSAQKAQAPDVSPVSGQSTNKFKLSFSKLPAIFGDKAKRTPTDKPGDGEVE